jgi:hypothetical protein
MNNYKCCTRCNKTHPATEEYFYKHKECAGGLNTRCKECMNEINRKWRENNKEKWRGYFNKYRQENPEKELETCRKYRAENPDRILKAVQKYRENNREKTREATHKWEQNNPERKREKSRRSTENRRARKLQAKGHFMAGDIQLQYKKQNGLCYWCDKELNGKYHIDHVIPLSRGGTNYPDNLVCSCAKCNCSKSNKLPNEWLEYRKSL